MESGYFTLIDITSRTHEKLGKSTTAKSMKDEYEKVKVAGQSAENGFQRKSRPFFFVDFGVDVFKSIGDPHT